MINSYIASKIFFIKTHSDRNKADFDLTKKVTPLF